MTQQITPTGYAEQGKWNGTRRAGEQFTEEQKAAMNQRGGAQRWDVRPVQIKRPRERTPMEVAAGMPRDEAFDRMDVDCPIVCCSTDKDLVIAPGGDQVWVKKRKRAKK